VQCITCDCCGGPLGSAIAFIVQAILCIGWVIYASRVTKSVQAIDKWDPNPEWNTTKVQDYRTAIVILTWAEAAMLGTLALVTMFTGCSPDNEKRK
jgi:hypothetical protein